MAQRKSKKIEQKTKEKNSDSETTKKSSKKKIEESLEQKAKKNKQHSEKLEKKQEARLPEHIERVRKKESKGQPANKERFYVTNAKLLEELNKLKGKDGKCDPSIKPSEELGNMIMMIAQRLSNHSNFKNYSYDLKQEMKAYAHFKCIQGLKNYNFKFNNAFSYFTTACYNAFVSTISKYYKTLNGNRENAKRALEQLQSTANINVSKILSQSLKEFIENDPTAKKDKED